MWKKRSTFLENVEEFMKKGMLFVLSLMAVCDGSKLPTHPPRCKQKRHRREGGQWGSGTLHAILPFPFSPSHQFQHSYFFVNMYIALFPHTKYKVPALGAKSNIPPLMLANAKARMHGMGWGYWQWLTHGLVFLFPLIGFYRCSSCAASALFMDLTPAQVRGGPGPSRPYLARGGAAGDKFKEKKIPF